MSKSLTKSPPKAEPTPNGLHDWQAAFRLRPDLLHRDITAFERAMFPRKRALVPARLSNWDAEVMLLSAIDAGWIQAPSVEVGEFEGERRHFYDGRNVQELPAGVVRWLGDRIEAHYDKATAIPKNW